MPMMNGFSFLEQLKRLGYAGAMIGITGSVMDDDYEKFKASLNGMTSPFIPNFVIC
jgi:CheY-like chemotaxis protein